MDLLVLLILFVGLPLFLVCAIIFTILIFIDCLRNEKLDKERILWCCAIFLVPIFGAMSYHFIRKPERKRVSRENDRRPLNKKAELCMILGICGFVLSQMVIGVPISFAGLFYGLKGLREYKTGEYRGQDLIKTGLIISSIPVVIVILILILLALTAILGKRL